MAMLGWWVSCCTLAYAGGSSPKSAWRKSGAYTVGPQFLAVVNSGHSHSCIICKAIDVCLLLCAFMYANRVLMAYVCSTVHHSGLLAFSKSNMSCLTSPGVAHLTHGSTGVILHNHR